MAKTTLPVLICLLCISANVQGLSENSFNLSADRHELIVGHSSGVKEEAGKVFHANAYARGNCNYASETSSNRNCTATVTHFGQSGVVGTRICGILRHIQPMTDRKEHRIRFLFQKNKAIFVYESEDENRLYQNFQIVEPRSDSCPRSNVSIPLGHNLPFIRQMNTATHTNIIVRDNGQYDIITDGDCGGARCKYTFDSEAQQISLPRAYLPRNYQNHSVKVFPSTKSHAQFVIVGEWPLEYQEHRHTTQMYFSEHAFNYEKLLYVQDGTEPTELASFARRGVPFHDMLADDSNGLFSFCRNDHVGMGLNRNYKLHCVQFSESTVKFNETTSFKGSERLLAVYNLPTEGVLLVKSKCPTELSCRGLTFEKWTVNPNGQTILSAQDVQFSSKIVKTIVHVEKGNNMCVTVYSEAPPPGGYNILYECFSNPFYTGGASTQSYVSITYIFTCITMLFFTLMNV